MKPAVIVKIEQVSPNQRRVHQVTDDDVICELPQGVHNLYPGYQIAALQNRAAAAEQQVTALTQRLDMANRLNTDARQQLAKLRLLPCGFYGDKWLGEDEFAAIAEALK